MGEKKKIQGTYFKICLTYFKISQTYFSPPENPFENRGKNADKFRHAYSEPQNVIFTGAECGCFFLLAEVRKQQHNLL